MSLHAISAGGEWSVHTPVYTGFSANPSGGFSRYILVGKLCVWHHQPSDGTSNATGFTITLPVPSAVATWQPCRATNNGVIAAAPGMVEIATSTATIYRDFAGLTWTASGSKNATFLVAYEAL